MLRDSGIKMMKHNLLFHYFAKKKRAKKKMANRNINGDKLPKNNFAICILRGMKPLRNNNSKY